jgi:alpha-D-ribose 1-methylphosphonate 5-triphosphate diphosphatase
MAVTELDKSLAASGITRIYHAVCVGAHEKHEMRSIEMATGIARGLDQWRPWLTVDHCFHARYEVTMGDGLEAIEQLIDQGLVGLCSFMDHTPGQGQYSTEAAYREFYRSEFMSEEAIDRMIAAQQEGAERAQRNVRLMAGICRDRGIPMAAHDLDCPERVAAMRELGMNIAEYPVTPAAASAARDAGMGVLMGGPNIVRGHSLSGNLSGVDAVRAGWCNLIGSDYAPVSLLHAIFQLADDACSLVEAVGMLTIEAARAVGIDEEVGSITPGKRADLVLVDRRGPVPRPVLTLASGRTVYSTLAPHLVEP